MSSTPVYPPLDDSFTVSGLVDFNVEHNPRQPLFVYSEEPGSLTEISFLEFGHATHRAAHLVRPGRTGPEGEIVAVVANTDSLLYEAIFAGMIRAGVVVSRNGIWLFIYNVINALAAVPNLLKKPCRSTGFNVRKKRMPPGDNHARLSWTAAA